VSWLDIKREESSVDRMITCPIQRGKSISPKQAEHITDDLFNQAEYILKKGKTITLLAEKPDELLPTAEKYGFVIKERRPILMGQRSMSIITFKNTKKKPKDNKEES